MGLYLNTDTDEQIPLASNAGWSSVGAWVETLGDAPEASHLWEHGWAEPVDDLLAELQIHLESSPPDKPDTAKTVQELIASLTTLPPDSAVVVTDGMEADDLQTVDAPPG